MMIRRLLDVDNSLLVLILRPSEQLYIHVVRTIIKMLKSTVDSRSRNVGSSFMLLEPDSVIVTINY